MIKKIIPIFLLLSILFVCIDEVNGLQTYVGVKILNLTDDPSSSCVGEPGYGSQGRIRAISSILPDFPIYFELKDASNGTIIWFGNDTKDTDYTIGDTIYLPEPVDLTIGKSYTLFFDVDAIRIYLPLESYHDNYGNSFNATVDNNYWTVGKIGNGDGERFEVSIDNGCGLYSSCWGADGYNLFFISNTRNSSKLISSCVNDSINNNCDELGIMGIWRTVGSDSYNKKDFRIDGKYNNLYLSDVGNFYLSFTIN